VIYYNVNRLLHFQAIAIICRISLSQSIYCLIFSATARRCEKDVNRQKGRHQCCKYYNSIRTTWTDFSFNFLLVTFSTLFWQIVNSLKQKLHAVERTVKDKEAELR